MPQYIKSILQTLTICLIVVMGAGLLNAWSAPTDPPPDGNTQGPINTGSSAQTKSGDLTVDGDFYVSILQKDGGGGIEVRETFDMNDNSITDVERIFVNNIYDADGGSKVEFRDDFDVKDNDICLNGDCISDWSDI